MKVKPCSIFQASNWFRRITIGLLFFVCCALLACGGGGSGGGSGGDSSLTYSGATTPASLTADNTDTLIAESFQGALTNDSMVPFAAMAGEGAVNDNESISTPITLNLQSVFADSLSQVINTPQEGRAATLSAAAMQTSTVNGDCGGTATYSVNYDESSGVFSGSFSYNSFCSGVVNLSGSATFSGRIDNSTGHFDYFSFTFSNLTTTADGQTNTVSGSLECDFQGSDVTITTDMVVYQSSSGHTCWLNNCTVQVSGSQMEISGRFYHPVHGFIDFITLEPLTISGTGQFPSAGIIEFTGAQETEARLTAISATHCRVTADTDGDGENEYDSGEIFWTEL